MRRPEKILLSLTAMFMSLSMSSCDGLFGSVGVGVDSGGVDISTGVNLPYGYWGGWNGYNGLWNGYNGFYGPTYYPGPAPRPIGRPVFAPGNTGPGSSGVIGQPIKPGNNNGFGNAPRPGNMGNGPSSGSSQTIQMSTPVRQPQSMPEWNVSTGTVKVEK